MANPKNRGEKKKAPHGKGVQGAAGAAGDKRAAGGKPPKQGGKSDRK